MLTETRLIPSIQAGTFIFYRKSKVIFEIPLKIDGVTFIREFTTIQRHDVQQYRHYVFRNGCNFVRESKTGSRVQK